MAEQRVPAPTTRRRRVVLVAVALLVVVAAVVLVVRVAREAGRSDLEQAMALAPDDALRFSWTDWAGVRREVDVPTTTSPAAGATVRDLLDRAFEADLSSTSALVESAESAQARLGFSPASIDWELFSQGPDGALVTMRLADGEAVAAVGEALLDAGFTEPDEPGGVWEGGPDVLARLGPTLTPEIGYVALDEEAGLVRTSDRPDFLAAVLDGDAPVGAHSEGLDDVVVAAGEPLSAAVYDGPYVCEALAMAGADGRDEAQAATLVSQAGEVNPLTGFAIGVQPGGDVRVDMALESDDQARLNTDSRAALASGPAPGQGGTFADRFTLDRASASGRVVTLELTPVDGAYVLSDLSAGPVLFATC